MDGIMYGDRYYRVTGKGFILEKNSLVYGEMSIGKDKKRAYECKPKITASKLTGGIFKVTQ